MCCFNSQFESKHFKRHPLISSTDFHFLYPALPQGGTSAEFASTKDPIRWTATTEAESIAGGNYLPLGDSEHDHVAQMSHVFFWNEGTFLCGELMLTPRKPKHWYLQVRVGTRKHFAEASR